MNAHSTHITMEFLFFYHMLVCLRCGAPCRLFVEQKSSHFFSFPFHRNAIISYTIRQSNSLSNDIISRQWISLTCVLCSWKQWRWYFVAVSEHTRTRLNCVGLLSIAFVLVIVTGFVLSFDYHDKIVCFMTRIPHFASATSLKYR